MTGFIQKNIRRVHAFWRAVGWQIPVLSVVALVLAAVSGLIAITAVFAGPLRLGLAEAFYLYRWLGWDRTDTMVNVALGILAAGVIAYIAYLGWPDRSSGRWRSFRSLLANSAVVMVSIVVGLLILEIFARLVDGVDISLLRNVTAERQALLRTQTANSYHPDLGWVLAENLPGDPSRPESAALTTGAHGVRMNSHEIVPIPVGGILASGDSFTAGSEVGNQYSWPAQLEQLIGIPVVNGGVGGWASDQIVLRVYDLLPVVKPKTVVVSFFQDDILRSGYKTYGGANTPWFTVEDGELVRHADPVPEFTGQASEVGGFSLIGYSYLVTFVAERVGFGDVWRRSQTSYVSAGNDPVAVSCLLLEKLKRDLDAQGIDLLFVMQFGGRASIHAAARQDHAVDVLACAKAAGIETVDMWKPQRDIGLADIDAYRGLFVMHNEGQVFGHMSATGTHWLPGTLPRALGPGLRRQCLWERQKMCRLP